MSKDRNTPSGNTRSKRPLNFKRVSSPVQREQEFDQNRSLSQSDIELEEEQVAQVVQTDEKASGFNPAFQLVRTPTQAKPVITDSSVVSTDNVAQLQNQPIINIQPEIVEKLNSDETEDPKVNKIENSDPSKIQSRNIQKSKSSSDILNIHSNNSSVHSIHRTQSQHSLHSVHSNHSNHTIHTSSELSISSSEHSLYRPYTPEQPNSKSNMVEETLKIKDIALTMPYFEGFQKDLDFFISTCKTYNETVTEAQRPLLLQVIKTKFKGIALAKMEPLTTLTSWAEVKTRLEEKFKRPNTYEHAQDEITRIHQARNETIEVYGNRFRMALHRLNKAAESLTESVEGLQVLRDTNEKYAVRKFEQNINNNELKFWVKMKNCKTLDAAIVVAMEEEDQFEVPRRIFCNYCSRNGHSERDCRQKQRERNQNSSNQSETSRTNQYYQNRFSTDSNSPPKNNYNNNGNSNTYNNRNSKAPYQNKNSGNDNRYQSNRNTNPNNYGNNSNRNKNKKYTGNEGSDSDPSNSQNARVSKNETKEPLTLNDVLKKEAKN